MGLSMNVVRRNDDAMKTFACHQLIKYVKEKSQV